MKAKQRSGLRRKAGTSAQRTGAKLPPETCFTSWLSDDIPLDQALRRLSSVGCKTVEVAGNREYLARASSIRSSLSRYGLSVATISAGVPFSQDPSLNLHARERTVREESVEYVRRCVDFASNLEARLVYVCSISKSGRDHSQSIERFTDSLRSCVDYAEKVGVRLAIEPYPTGEIPSAKGAGDLVERVGSTSLGILLDTGHMAIAGEGPRETSKRWKRSIFHIHLNNNDGSRDLHWPPQRGLITDEAFRGMMHELRSGYSGLFSVELRNPDPLEGTVAETIAYVDSLF